MLTNWAHVHLLVNHIPVLGTVFGLALLAIVMKGNREDGKKAALGTFVVVALVAILTYLTGEPAEEVVEHLPGISEDIIETHEEFAIVSLVAVEVLGLVSLVGLFLSRKSARIPPRLVTICLALSLAAVATLAWTSHLGGQIRHPEIRSGFVGPTDND